jgi:hypothetical protein
MFMLARGSTIGSVLGGLVGPGDCAISPPGSGFSVNVAPGEVVVPGSTSALQSGYVSRVASASNLSIVASHTSLPRIDTVVAQVQDAAYAGAVNSFAVAVVTGTASAGATLANLTGAGAVPASSLVLGYVLAPAAATNIVGGDILNVATTATPGLPLLGSVIAQSNMTAKNGQAIVVTSPGVTIALPIPSATTLLSVSNFSTGATTVSYGTAAIFGEGLASGGATSFQLGTPGANALLLGDGAGWAIIGGQQDTGWVALGPTLNAGWTTTPGAYAPSVRLRGDRGWFKGSADNGTGGSTSSLGSLPSATFRPTSGVNMVAQTGSNTVTTFQIASGGALSFGSNLANGNTILLDGISYTLS